MPIEPGFPGITPGQIISEGDNDCVCTVTRSISATTQKIVSPPDFFFEATLSITMTVDCRPLGESVTFIDGPRRFTENINGVPKEMTHYNSLLVKQFPAHRCSCPIILDDGTEVTTTSGRVFGFDKFDKHLLRNYSLSEQDKKEKKLENFKGSTVPAAAPFWAKFLMTAPVVKEPVYEDGGTAGHFGGGGAGRIAEPYVTPDLVTEAVLFDANRRHIPITPAGAAGTQLARDITNRHDLLAHDTILGLLFARELDFEIGEFDLEGMPNETFLRNQKCCPS